MSTQRVEVMHHTPEQVAEYLAAAIQVCDGLYSEGEAPFEVVCAVLNLLASKTIQQVVPQPIDLGALNLENGRRRF